MTIRATKPDTNPAQHGRRADQDHPAGLGPSLPLRKAWGARDYSKFHGWDRRSADVGDPDPDEPGDPDAGAEQGLDHDDIAADGRRLAQ